MTGSDVVADPSVSKRDSRLIAMRSRSGRAMSGRVILLGTIIGCALTWLLVGYWLFAG